MAVPDLSTARPGQFSDHEMTDSGSDDHGEAIIIVANIMIDNIIVVCAKKRLRNSLRLLPIPPEDRRPGC